MEINCVTLFYPQLNGSMASGVLLRVSMARRQPSFETAPDPSSNAWATIGQFSYAYILL